MRPPTERLKQMGPVDIESLPTKSMNPFMSFGSRPVACISFLSALVLAGCTRAIVVQNESTTVTEYHAYGASITYGATLSDPATQAFPALVAAYEHVPLENYAISGNQACDLPPRQIFAHKDSPTVARRIEYTVLVGTNDANIKGIGAYESVFILCYQASLSWLAIPAEYKTLANDNRVAISGDGAINSSNNWNAWTTAGQGSTVSFPITLTEDGPIYAWPLIDDNHPATYTYSLDGAVLGTASTQTNPSISTGAGTTTSLGFLRLPLVLAGNHVLTFTQVSAGTDGVSVVGVGTPAPSTTRGLPAVLAGTITYQFDTGKCTATLEQPCLAYNKDIEDLVDLFSADGLNVHLFDTRKFMFGTAAEMNDSLHPNALGHVELSRAVEASW